MAATSPEFAKEEKRGDFRKGSWKSERREGGRGKVRGEEVGEGRRRKEIGGRGREMEG